MFWIITESSMKLYNLNAQEKTQLILLCLQPRFYHLKELRSGQTPFKKTENT